MKILSGAYWNRGKRSSNQDSLTLSQVMTSRGRAVLAAVSDGIGGLAEGENASGYILEQLVEDFYGEMVDLIARGGGRTKIQKSLLRCFFRMNQTLKRYGDSRDIKLGATISVLLIWSHRYVIFHLGDSRIYEYRGKRMKLLTRDHSEGQTGITRCMGSFSFQYPDISWGHIWGKRGFLLCTDGFYKVLETGKMKEVLTPTDIKAEKQIERRLQGLGGLALQKGGTDNLSALYLKIG